MEQILLSQLTAVHQTAAHLLLKSHPDTIVRTLQKIDELINSEMEIAIDIKSQADACLALNKVQLIVVRQYSNGNKQIEQLYCGQYNRDAIEYVKMMIVNRQHRLANSTMSRVAPIKLKLTPFIESEPSFVTYRKQLKKRISREKKKIVNRARESDEDSGFRSTDKKSRVREQSLKNQQEIFGPKCFHRRCYCCNNKSESSQESSDSVVFIRSPRKIQPQTAKYSNHCPPIAKPQDENCSSKCFILGERTNKKLINFKGDKGATERNKINYHQSSKSQQKSDFSQTHRTANNTRYKSGVNALEVEAPEQARESQRPSSTWQHRTPRQIANEDKNLVHFRVKHGREKQNLTKNEKTALGEKSKQREKSSRFMVRESRQGTTQDREVHPCQEKRIVRQSMPSVVENKKIKNAGEKTKQRDSGISAPVQSMSNALMTEQQKIVSQPCFANTNKSVQSGRQKKERQDQFILRMTKSNPKHLVKNSSESGQQLLKQQESRQSKNPVIVFKKNVDSKDSTSPCHNLQKTEEMNNEVCALPFDLNQKENKTTEKDGKIKKVTVTQQKQLFQRTKDDQKAKSGKENNKIAGNRHFKRVFQREKKQKTEEYNTEKEKRSEIQPETINNTLTVEENKLCDEKNTFQPEYLQNEFQNCFEMKEEKQSCSSDAFLVIKKENQNKMPINSMESLKQDTQKKSEIAQCQTLITSVKAKVNETSSPGKKKMSMNHSSHQHIGQSNSFKQNEIITDFENKQKNERLNVFQNNNMPSIDIEVSEKAISQSEEGNSNEKSNILEIKENSIEESKREEKIQNQYELRDQLLQINSAEQKIFVESLTPKLKSVQIIESSEVVQNNKRILHKSLLPEEQFLMKQSKEVNWDQKEEIRGDDLLQLDEEEERIIDEETDKQCAISNKHPDINHSLKITTFKLIKAKTSFAFPPQFFKQINTHKSINFEAPNQSEQSHSDCLQASKISNVNNESRLQYSAFFKSQSRTSLKEEDKNLEKHKVGVTKFTLEKSLELNKFEEELFKNEQQQWLSETVIINGHSKTEVKQCSEEIPLQSRQTIKEHCQEIEENCMNNIGVKQKSSNQKFRKKSISYQNHEQKLREFQEKNRNSLTLQDDESNTIFPEEKHMNTCSVEEKNNYEGIVNHDQNVQMRKKCSIQSLSQKQFDVVQENNLENFYQEKSESRNGQSIENEIIYDVGNNSKINGEIIINAQQSMKPYEQFQTKKEGDMVSLRVQTPTKDKNIHDFNQEKKSISAIEGQKLSHHEITQTFIQRQQLNLVDHSVSEQQNKENLSFPEKSVEKQHCQFNEKQQIIVDYDDFSEQQSKKITKNLVEDRNNRSQLEVKVEDKKYERKNEDMLPQITIRAEISDKIQGIQENDKSKMTNLEKSKLKEQTLNSKLISSEKLSEPSILSNLSQSLDLKQKDQTEIKHSDQKVEEKIYQGKIIVSHKDNQEDINQQVINHSNHTKNEGEKKIQKYFSNKESNVQITVNQRKIDQIQKEYIDNSKQQKYIEKTNEKNRKTVEMKKEQNRSDQEEKAKQYNELGKKQGKCIKIKNQKEEQQQQTPHKSDNKCKEDKKKSQNSLQQFKKVTSQKSYKDVGCQLNLTQSACIQTEDLSQYYHRSNNQVSQQLNKTTPQVKSEYQSIVKRVVDKDQTNDFLLQKVKQNLKSDPAQIKKSVKKEKLLICEPQIASISNEYLDETDRKKSVPIETVQKNGKIGSDQEKKLSKLDDQKIRIDKSNKLQLSKQRDLIKNIENKEVDGCKEDKIGNIHQRNNSNSAFSQNSSPSVRQSINQLKKSIIEELDLKSSTILSNKLNNVNKDTEPALLLKLKYYPYKIVQVEEEEMLTFSTNYQIIIQNAIKFLQFNLSGWIQTLFNQNSSKICLFVKQQWTLFQIHNKTSINILKDVLNWQLQTLNEQITVYTVLKMLTAFPLRTLIDKQGISNNKRLMRSVQFLLEQKNQQSNYYSQFIGLSKPIRQVVTLQKVRHFKGEDKTVQTILECKSIEGGLNDDNLVEKKINFEGETVSKFIEFHLMKNPYFYKLRADEKITTFQFELPPCIIFIHQPFKFILYEEANPNQYVLIKQCHSWLKHINKKQRAKFLLIIEPQIEDYSSQFLVKVGLSKEQPNQVRLVKYEEGGRAKDHQGGYQNRNSLYLPIQREITHKIGKERKC